MAPRTATSAADRKTVVLTPEEVRKHSGVQSAWLVIKGKVYDVTDFSEHPGGKVLYTYAGADATDVFQGFHSGEAHGQLAKYYIGDVAQPLAEADAPFEREVRAMHGEIVKRGLHKSSKLYYAYKFASTTALAVLAYYLAGASSLAGVAAGALSMGFFWQQSGWLAHDFAHHQVFKTRFWNDVMTLILGNFYLSFSLDWWKNKHNTHHAIPNVHETAVDAHDGDPDIDTLPFLAWSGRLLAKVTKGTAGTPLSRFFVAHQQYLYFPLLLFARLIWAAQSISFVFRIEAFHWGAVKAEEATKKSAGAKNFVDIGHVKLRYEVAERALLILHYVVLAAFAVRAGSLGRAALFFAISQLSSGLLIAIAFGVGHNGMPCFDADAKPGYSELQVRTTRNVADTAFNAWFCGGLHFQIEHHIFPTVPRHNLAAVSAMLRPICAKYNVPHRTRGLVAGTLEVLSHLREISEDMRMHGPQ